MTKQNIIKTLKNFNKSSAKKRKAYFDAFEQKMIYRTTKTENPTTTKRLVKKVLNKV